MNQLKMKKRTLSTFASILFSVLLLLAGTGKSYGASSNYQSEFLKANKNYYEGRYDKAMQKGTIIYSHQRRAIGGSSF